MPKSKNELSLELEEARSHIAELEQQIAKSDKFVISLIESEKEKRLILDNLSELITYYDRDLRILYVNKTAIESLGLTADKVIGMRCSDVFEKYNLPKPKWEPCLVREPILNGKPYKGNSKSSNGKFW